MVAVSQWQVMCLFKSSRKLGSEIRSVTASVIKVGRGPGSREMRLLCGDARASVAGRPASHASCGEQGEEIPSEGPGAGAAPGVSPLSSLRGLRHKAAVPHICHSRTLGDLH